MENSSDRNAKAFNKLNQEYFNLLDIEIIKAYSPLYFGLTRDLLGVDLFS